MVQFTIYKLRRTVPMDDNISVIQRADSPLLQPVQIDLIRKFNEHPELFQPQINPSIAQTVQNTQRMYDNLPKTNIVAEEVRAVKSEIQIQTAEIEKFRQENSELKAIISDQNTKLDEANELNRQQKEEIVSLQNQLHESTASKVGKRIFEAVFNILIGVLLAFVLYYIGKKLGISLS